MNNGQWGDKQAIYNSLTKCADQTLDPNQLIKPAAASINAKEFVDAMDPRQSVFGRKQEFQPGMNWLALLTAEQRTLYRHYIVTVGSESWGGAEAVGIFNHYLLLLQNSGALSEQECLAIKQEYWERTNPLVATVAEYERTKGTDLE